MGRPSDQDDQGTAAFCWRRDGITPEEALEEEIASLGDGLAPRVAAIAFTIRLAGFRARKPPGRFHEPWTDDRLLGRNPERLAATLENRISVKDHGRDIAPLSAFIYGPTVDPCWWPDSKTPPKPAID
jgi:hypothetical protein